MSAALTRFRQAPIHKIEVDGTALAYRCIGEGPPLIFVHGWPLSGLTFRGLVDELAADYTCYVIDLPGAGESAWDPSVRDIFDDFGRLVAGFAGLLELQGVVYIGHDSGGTIARLAAAREPSRVRGLVLTNTELPGLHVKTIETFQKMTRLPGATAIFKLLVRSRIFLHSKFGFGGAFADKATIDGEFWETAIEPLQRNVDGALAQLRAADLDVVDRLAAVHAELKMPVLAVWGDCDPFFPISPAREMLESWQTRSELVTVPGHRLLVHEDAAGVVAAHTRRFLEGLVSAPAFPSQANSA